MWAVIIYNSIHKHVEKFNELKGRYGAIRYCIRMRVKFAHRDDVKVEVISCLKAYKPKGEKTRKDTWWCPYCRKYRRFYHDGYIGIKKCPVCQIGESDFYVKTYNKLWHKGKGDKGKKKVDKK